MGSTKASFTKHFFENVCKEYGLDSFISAKPFVKGYVQINMHLKTSSGDYVFRYYALRSLNYIQFEVNVLDYLSKHHFKTPTPLKNKSGKFITAHNSKHYTIFRYMPGRHRKHLSAKALNNVLRTLAKFHNITEGYKPKYYTFRESNDVKYVWNECSLRAKKMKTEIGSKRLTFVKNNLKKLSFPSALPKGVVHADYNVDNIKFKGDEIVSVLDFDSACYTHLNYDVASQIWWLAWPQDKEFNKTKAKRVIKIYNKYRTLTKLERKHLFDSLAILILTHMTWSFDETQKRNPFEYYSKRLNWLMNIGREEFSSYFG